MIVLSEYAQLANRVYNRTAQNRTPIPDGWTELGWFKDDINSGFSAGWYQKGNDIVVSYTGTNETKLLDAFYGYGSAVDLPTRQIGQAMTLYLKVKQQYPQANISFTGHSLGAGLAALMAVYFNRPATVFDEAPFEASALKAESLLYYSPAYFQRTLGLQDSQYTEYFNAVQSGSGIYGAREGNVSTYSVEYEALAPLRALFGTIGTPNPALPIGKQTLVEGMPTSFGSIADWLGVVGNAAGIGAGMVELHSMTLLASMVASQKFKEVVPKSPFLLESIFNKKLYSTDPQNSVAANFIDKLYIEQVQRGGVPLLDLFADEIAKLNSPSGTTAKRPFQKALTVAVMDYFYQNKAGSGAAYFSQESGALKFNYKEMDMAGSKSLNMLSNAVWSLDDDAGKQSEDAARKSKNWYVSSGLGGLNINSSGNENSAYIGGDANDQVLSGSGNDLIMGLAGADTLLGSAGLDVISGGSDNDKLDGGDGDDQLFGGEDSDTLNGGADDDMLNGGEGSDDLDGGTGNDHLYGGKGDDTYRFSGSFGSDVIKDDEGSDRIVVEKLGGSMPKGKLKGGAGSPDSKVYVSEDKKVTYLLIKQGTKSDLVISLKDSSDQITIKNWSKDRNFGIELDDTAAPQTSTSTFIGDYQKKNFSEQGTSYGAENRPGVGITYASDGGQAADSYDLVNGDEGSANMMGLGGNDGLEGGDGDDYIDGGTGTDLLLGGLGSDSIFGGAGDDYIFGSARGTFQFPTGPSTPDPTWDVKARGMSWFVIDTHTTDDRGNKHLYDIKGVDVMSYLPAINMGPKVYAHETAGNLLDGGEGKDLIVSGTGKDTAYGGAGDDTIFGLADNDALFGDDGEDYLWGDGGFDANYLYAEPDDHGDDTLVGGAGKDQLVGQGGNDELYGGADDDSLWGDDDNYTYTPDTVHGNDYLDGGDGNDKLIGGGGIDELFGGKGDDLLWGDNDDKDLSIDFHGADYLDGEEGNDQLAGQGGDDELFGGDGNDSMWGDSDMSSRPNSQAKGNDYLDGEGGDDVLVGGRGDDTLYGGDGGDGLTGDDNALAASDHGSDMLYGQAGNDTLEGNGGDDLLDGGDDNDILNGGKGNDTLLGGTGDDLITGGAGDDLITGGAGIDDLQGGEGDDTYFISAGDALQGEDALTEAITDEAGRNKVVFGAGVTKESITSALFGGDLAIEFSANDVLAVTASSVSSMSFVFSNTGETLSSQQLISQTASGKQRVINPDGTTTWYGDNTNNSFSITTLNTSIYGGHGNDSVTALASGLNYRYAQGDGVDRIQYRKDTSGATQNRLTFDAGISAANISWQIENNSLRISTGGSSASGGGTAGGGGGGAIYVDNFSAGGSADALGLDQIVFDDGSTMSATQLLQQSTMAYGTDANDVQQGALGDDILVSSAGNDTLKGWQGSDAYFWGTASGQDTIDDGVASTADVDTLVISSDLGPLNVVLTQVADDLLIRTRTSTDTLTVKNHFTGKGLEKILFADAMVWNAQDITAHLSNELTDGADYYNGTAAANFVNGQGGNDTLYGRDGADALDGGAGSDSIYGGEGDDTLIGGLDADKLFGENGNDVLDGRGDNAGDTLTGGEGSDVYMFGRGSGADSINDQGTQASDIDTLKFDASVTRADVIFSSNGGVMRTATIKGTTDSVTFTMNKPGTGTVYSIENIAFADGTNWDWAQFTAKSLENAGTAGADTIYGFETNDLIKALDGNDYLNGGDGNDTLDGGNGLDVIDAGWGDDTLIDGDTMYGGVGADTYILSKWQTARIEELPSGNSEDILILPVPDTAVTVSRGSNWNTMGNDDLVLTATVDGVQSSVTIVQYLIDQGNDKKVETIRFANGASWSFANVLARLKDANPTAGSDKSIAGFRWADRIDGLAGDDGLYGMEGNDTLIGGAGDDALYGDVGNDDLSGGTGHDLMKGEKGADTYRFGLGYGQDEIVESGSATPETDTIALDNGLTEADVKLTQMGDDLVLQLKNGPDQLIVRNQFNTGAPGYDFKIEQIAFAGGATWDAAKIAAMTVSGAVNAMTGTTGNDTFTVDNTRDTVSEAADAGVDTIITSVSYALPTNVENLTATGTLNLELSGNALDNVLTGNAGNNTFNGWDNTWWAQHGYAGSTSAGDTMIGGLGDDIYYLTPFSAGGGRIIENANEGNDTAMVSTYDYTLADNVETMVLLLSSWSYSYDSGAHVRRLIGGNAQANLIDGSLAIVETRIDGGGGADTMIGSTGYGDIYVVDDAADVVVEDVDGQGVDKIETTINYTLSQGVEWLTLKGEGAITATGNAAANWLDGSTNNAANVLRGGLGDDTYIVDWHDTVEEATNAGTDTVRLAYGYQSVFNVSDIPFQNIEGYSLDDNMGGSSLVGNAANNILTGNRSNNELFGGDGDDMLVDGTGTFVSETGGRYYQDDSDRLVGGAGNDTLTVTSHNGSDTLDGGAGNDLINIQDTGSASAQVVFGRGYDADRVVNRQTYGARTVVLNADTDLSDLRFSRSGADLVIAIDGTTDSLTWTGFYIDAVSSDLTANTMTGLSFADGMNVSAAQVAARVLSGNQNVVSDQGDLLVGTSAAELINGLAGDDVLAGGAGNDTLVGGDGADFISGGAGNDDITGGLGDDSLQGGRGSDIYRFSSGDGWTQLDDTEGALDAIVFDATIRAADVTVRREIDRIVFTFANSSDVLSVGGYFGDGSGVIEEVRFSNGTIWSAQTVRDMSSKILGTSGDDNLIGTSGADSLYGFEGADMLTGDDGNDLLDGGIGADSLYGGFGDDSYVVDNSGDRVYEYADGGNDVVKSSVTYTLSSEVESLQLQGGAAINGTGNAGNNLLQGNDGNNSLSGLGGNDTIDGGAGADSMSGGTGDDVYYVDNAGDTTTESSGQGTDTVYSSVSLTLATNVENLVLTGNAALNGTGNASGNRIEGNSSGNMLNGLAGNDTMLGGLGDDIYVVDVANDVIIENANEGTDTVQSAVTFSIASYNNVENIALQGSNTANATGNALNNVLTGNSAANTLTGGAGNDTLNGLAGNDTMVGGTGDDVYLIDVTTDVITENANEGTDTVQSSITFSLAAINNVENLTLLGSSAANATGNALNNVLTGNGGVNVLDGGTGADTMVGGAGDDSYTVDNTADVVTEQLNEGVDSVNASVSYTLGANVEKLTLTGSNAINGTGNGLDNTLTGNGAANVLNGGAGNDMLSGLVGNDTMIGGLGDDTYVIDVTTDVITENANEGTDTVQSNITFSLAAINNVENLTLLGSSTANATGNALNNVLTGNSAANTLTGGAGNDTLNGLAGNDTMVGGTGDDVYLIDVTTDVITENANEGTDTVQSSITFSLAAINNVENLTLLGSGTINATGNSLNNVLTGNSGVNSLTGNAGNDTLDGGAGADSLIGGTGDDLYIVDNTADKLTENASEGTDTVQSYVTWTLATNFENLTLTGAAAINGTGNSVANVLTGNDGANTLTGGGGNDTYRGGLGNDVLSATVAASNDTYIWGRGEGADTLTDAGGTDQLQILAGVSADQVWFRHVGNNLELSVIGGGDSFTINNWYSGAANQVESFKLANGKTLQAANVNKLVDAMAAFTPPAAGQTTLPTSYQSSLNPVITANWV